MWCPVLFHNGRKPYRVHHTYADGQMFLNSSCAWNAEFIFESLKIVSFPTRRMENDATVVFQW